MQLAVLVRMHPLPHVPPVLTTIINLLLPPLVKVLILLNSQLVTLHAMDVLL